MAALAIRAFSMSGRGAEAVLNGFPEPVLLLDRRLQIVAANRAAETLFSRGLVGRRLISIVRWPEVLSCVTTALNEQRRDEVVVRSPDQVKATWNIFATPIEDSGEDDPAVVLSLRDISHVEEAERMRSDFVANVSHELRSPLTALSGFIETLQGPAAEDTAARERFLEIMEREAARMDRLIDDLISLSRIEVNRHVRPTETMDLREVLAEVVATLEQVASEAKVELRLVASDARCDLQADRDQLIQVFRNLIENAIKYGSHGEAIDIRLTLLDKALGLPGAAAQVEVRDYGRGISPEHLPRLTERFYRVDEARSRAHGGTGLGLAIVKHIVNRHRGRLNVNSELGAGSTFSVTLPRSRNFVP